jgi:hypothetical protein
MFDGKITARDTASLRPARDWASDRFEKSVGQGGNAGVGFELPVPRRRPAPLPVPVHVRADYFSLAGRQ